MTYSAYIEDPAYPGKFPVFPRSKRTNVFKNVKTASQALERAARRLTHDTRGLVYDTDGNLVHSIAL